MKALRLGVMFLLISMAGLVMAQKVRSVGECSQIYLTSNENKDRQADDARFSATQIMDLQIHVAFRADLEGEHILRLKLFTPDNHLYQELTQPLTTASLRNGALRQVAGFPRPLRVQTIKPLEVRGANGLGVTIGFPVAGTNIVTSSLYGSWRVEAYLDEETAPCSQKRIFQLVP